MSSDINVLAIRLVGPLQSWGFDSQYNRRNTGLMPTKSALAGICCASLGYSRGSDKEHTFLATFNAVRMTAMAIPRILYEKELPARRLQDFHTVGGGYDPNIPTEHGCITVKAEDGKPRQKNGQSLAVLTHRQYLNDSSFGVLLEGAATFLEEIADALKNPVWGIWLGRKACIPTAPVFAGLMENRAAALKVLIGEKTLEAFTRQEETDNFADGQDTIPDVAVSFASERRQFSQRRVHTIQGQTEKV